MKKSNKKGITLIALIITIIVLLVLAGITISLTIGERGIINRTQEAGKIHQEATVRESLVLKLGDLQTQKLADEKRKAVLNDTNEFMIQGSANYDIDIKDVVVEEKTADITIDKYVYTIDENFNIINKKESDKISELINNFVPTIKDENGTYFTIDVSDITTNNGSTIERFIYIVNGEIKEETNLTNYRVTGLDLNTSYEIKVIAIDQNGKEKNSKIVNYTTSNRQYIYNYGKEYIELTNGWIRGGSANGGQGIKNVDHLYLNSPVEQNNFTTYVFRTTNKIDISKFNSVHAIITVTNFNSGGGGLYISTGTFNGEYSYYGEQIGNVISNNKLIYSYDRYQAGNCVKKELNKELDKTELLEYGFAMIAAGGLNDRATMYVYQIWFE